MTHTNPRAKDIFRRLPEGGAVPPERAQAVMDAWGSLNRAIKDGRVRTFKQALKGWKITRSMNPSRVEQFIKELNQPRIPESEPKNPSGQSGAEFSRSLFSQPSRIVGVFNVAKQTFTPSPGLPGGDIGTVSGGAATLGALKTTQGVTRSQAEQRALQGGKPSAKPAAAGVAVAVLAAIFLFSKK